MRRMTFEISVPETAPLMLSHLLPVYAAGHVCGISVVVVALVVLVDLFLRAQIELAGAVVLCLVTLANII
jgi:hypothetical protein